MYGTALWYRSLFLKCFVFVYHHAPVARSCTLVILFLTKKTFIGQRPLLYGNFSLSLSTYIFSIPSSWGHDQREQCHAAVESVSHLSLTSASLRKPSPYSAVCSDVAYLSEICRPLVEIYLLANLLISWQWMHDYHVRLRML